MVFLFILLLSSVSSFANSQGLSSHIQSMLNELSIQELFPAPDHQGIDPEAYMDFCGIATYHGYNCEEYLHEIVTEDGFLLTIHRINGRLGTKPTSERPTVFVQHGLLADSASWILNLPNQSIPFILSDAGFDVWLGNSRGNTYSKAHKTLSPDSEEFWAWSWPEMAAYDLPACLDFIVARTSYKQVYYLGHSQGTLIAFAYLSTTADTRIKHLLALGPIYKVAEIESPIRYLAPYSRQIQWIAQVLGFKDFLPSDFIIQWLARHLCPKERTGPLCSDVIFLFCGVDRSQLNETRIPVYVSHTPAGSSVRNIVHFAQMVDSRNCSKFDYGDAKLNMKYYGQAYPPSYNITNITTPISLFWAENDWLADPEDVKVLIANLKTVVNNVYIPAWDHLDFIWAVDTEAVLAERLVEILNHL